MKTKKEAKQQKNVLSTIQSAVNNLLTHKEILYPFAIIAFVQLFILEILYFYPRFPLKTFFGPLVNRLWSPEFMHYPANLLLLPKLFQSVQIPLYILVNTFFIAVAVAIIVAINNDQKVQLKKIYRETWGLYIHLVVAAIITFAAIWGLFKLYALVYNRALMIRSTTGLYFWLKTTVIDGAPYFQFLISILVTAIFAYVIPIIVVDRKKVFTAIWINFKVLMRSFFFTFFVVLLPSLLYVVVLLLRIYSQDHLPSPDWRVGLIILNIVVLILIDAIVYTALTTYYLITKENQ